MNDSPSGKDHPADLGCKASEPANDDNAPLVCPGCKPDPGGQTGDLGLTAEPCPMPARPLDAALEQRFRSDELRAAFDGLEFSEALSWGDVKDLGTGLKAVWNDRIIDGAITLGAFEYDPCGDDVGAPATVTFTTRDGTLAATAHGLLVVRANELGRPADAAPSFQLYAHDDLTTARGRLDLMADPAVVHDADLDVSIGGTPGKLHGRCGSSVRVSEPGSAGCVANAVGRDLRECDPGVRPRRVSER